MLERRASILAPLRDSKDTKKILENKVFLRLFPLYSKDNPSESSCHILIYNQNEISLSVGFLV